MSCFLNKYASNQVLHHLKIFICGAMAMAVILLLNNDHVVASPNTNDPNPPPVLEQNTDTFEYQLENRPDPFVPFITEEATTSNINMNEIVDEDILLKGMQLFEPGQLTLVALMKIDLEDIAMVEDFTGKGYVLTEGIKIGRRGVVKDIASNSIIIEETAFTRAGKKIINNIVMLLKKEGDN